LTDSMTRVGSRKLIEDELEDECARAQRYGRMFSLAVIDLDNFKTINDVLGHTTGDDALKKLADCMNHQKRKQDVLGRYGGDEFVMVLPETRAKDASVLLERLRAEVKRIKIARDVSMTISCGIAQSLEDGTTTPRELFRRADLALYEAKNAGRNCVRIWDQNMSKRLNESDMEIEKIKRLQRRIAGLSEKSEKMFIQSIWGLVQALEAKDAYAKKHSENVTSYARSIAETMGMGPWVIEVIHNAAMLHDIGKIGVPDAILSKPGSLTRRERQIVAQHPLIAVKILEKMTFLEQELEIVRHHHEAWNGQGYPDGLAGTSIPLGARILAVADTLDALTSNRSYRQPRSVSEATGILLDSSGYDFDPCVVEAAMCWIDRVRDKLGKTAEVKPEDLLSTRPLVAETTTQAEFSSLPMPP
jgi:diguanylate cyclase (GGDEF)-like protein/putative nucleotidyltransferase with HDIG domain